MIIFHDYFKINGGGEYFIYELSKKLKTKIYTLYCDKKNIENYNNIFPFFKLKISTIPLFAIFNYLFIRKKFKDINSPIILSGNYCIFLILNPFYRNYKKIIYMHSLPKILFYENYYIKLNFFYKIIIKVCYPIFFLLLKNIFKKSKYIIFNSKNTQKTFDKYFYDLKINSYVMYPFFLKNLSFNKKKCNFFIFNSRHEKNKNIEKLLSVFSKLPNKKLVLTNQGSLTNDLKKKYHKQKNISFVGLCDRKKYESLLNSAIACIFLPNNEDFGISPIESLVYGCNLIHTNSGGYTEILSNLDKKLIVNLNDIENSLYRIIYSFGDNLSKDRLNNSFLKKYQFNISKFQSLIN